MCNDNWQVIFKMKWTMNPVPKVHWPFRRRMMMKFKQGCGWKACYDEERNLYTAERSGAGSYHLYEITKDIYDQLENGVSDDKVGYLPTRG